MIIVLRMAQLIMNRVLAMTNLVQVCTIHITVIAGEFLRLSLILLYDIAEFFCIQNAKIKKQLDGAKETRRNVENLK